MTVGDLDVEIPREEWEMAASLLPFASTDERDVTGMVRLRSDGSRRTWCATDSFRLALDRGDVDERTYEVLVSPRLVHLALQAARSFGIATLSVRGDADGPVTVSVNAAGGGPSLRVSADRRRFPDVEEMIARFSTGAAATMTLDADEFAELAARARWRPLDGPDVEDVNPLFWIGLDGAGLAIRLDWPDLGLTEYRLAGATSGDAAQAVSPLFLGEALGILHGDVELSVPQHPGQAILLRGDTRVVLIMPIETSFENHRGNVERLLSDVFGPDVLHRDGDEDYPLSKRSTPIYAHLVPDSPVRIQVFAVVIDGIDSTPELLAELNDHNSRLAFARTFWVSGQVLLESDLVADTADPPELIAAFERVRDAAEALGPVLAVVHGGELTSVASIEHRWATYAAAVISAEARPAEWVVLAGPGASANFPYAGPVHVITAHDPYGRARPAGTNDAANVDLAAHLTALGAGFHRAMGADANSDHAEASLLTWDLGLEAARSVGRQFGQEAVFEITANEVRVVSCTDERVLVVPRMPDGVPEPPR